MTVSATLTETGLLLLALAIVATFPVGANLPFFRDARQIAR